MILADLDHVFSRQDFDTPVLVHPSMGLGPQAGGSCAEDPVSHPGPDGHSGKAPAGEPLREQRILYVAMTRPKEKLILVDALYHAESRLQKLAAVASCPVQPETVASCRTFGSGCCCRCCAARRRSRCGIWRAWSWERLYEGDTAPWQVFCHDGEEFRARPRPAASLETEEGAETFDPALLEFVYPYQRGDAAARKVTATQLKGRPLDEEISQNAHHTPYLRPLSQPRFRQERQGLTAAEQGTATHLVLQYLDFSDLDVAGQVESCACGAVDGRTGRCGGPGSAGAVPPLAAGRGDPPGPKCPAGVSLHPLDGCPGLRPGRRGRERPFCSRAWWTAALRRRRGSRWWISRPTGC